MGKRLGYQTHLFMLCRVDALCWDDGVSSLDANLHGSDQHHQRVHYTWSRGSSSTSPPFNHKCGCVTWCASTLALDSLQLFFLCIASYNSPNETTGATGHIQVIDLMTPTLLFKVLKSLFSHPLLTYITRESPTWISHRMCWESFQN